MSSPIQRWRVPLGFLFALVFLYFSKPTPGFFVFGLGVAFLGLSLRFWAAGYLEKMRRLATAGPYRRTRNPLYLGSFVMGLGLTLAGGRWLLVLLFVACFLAVYLPVMKREEGELRQVFGAEFEDYRRRVPLFLPFGAPGLSGNDLDDGGSSDASGFRWGRAWANREYNAGIGLLILATVLSIKMLW